MINNPIISIAKKEFLDNFRNKWIFILSLLFVVLTLFVSYYGVSISGAPTGGSEGWSGLEQTVEGMKILVILIIPIISLILGYASIIGEIEKGSMSSLLSYPTNRFEIVMGKFFGLGSVVISTVLIGFGIGGVIVLLLVPESDFGYFLLFLINSLLVGLAFISIALLFSSIFKRRNTAMGFAIFLWIFLSIIWFFIIIAAMITSLMISGGSANVFDIINGMILINPLMTIYVYGQSETNSLLIVLSLVCWTFLPLIMTYFFFNRRDI